MLSRLVEKQGKAQSSRHFQEGERVLNQILPDTGHTNRPKSPPTHRNQRDEDDEDIECPASGEVTLKVPSTRERASLYEKGQGGANAGPNSHAYAGVAGRPIEDPSADESSASSRWDAESSTSDDSLQNNGSSLVGPQPRRSNDSGPGLFDGTNSQLADNGLGAIDEGTGHMLDTVFLNRGYSFKRGDDEHLPVTSPSHRKVKGPDSDSMYLYTYTPFDDVSSVRPDCVGSPSEKRPARPAGLAPSTSTGSVIWRGNDDTIRDERTPRASACENQGEDSDGGSQQ